MKRQPNLDFNEKRETPTKSSSYTEAVKSPSSTSQANKTCCTGREHFVTCYAQPPRSNQLLKRSEPTWFSTIRKGRDTLPIHSWQFHGTVLSSKEMGRSNFKFGSSVCPRTRHRGCVSGESNLFRQTQQRLCRFSPRGRSTG